MAQINIPDINDGEDASANSINTRIGKIVDLVNGNLDNANLANNAVTRDKIASESVTQDKIDWEGQGVIFYQTFGGNTSSIGKTESNFVALPSITLPLRSGYSYNIFMQIKQVNTSSTANQTYNVVIRNGSTEIGRGSMGYYGTSSYIDPTVYVSAHYKATTTGNATISIKNVSNHSSGNRQYTHTGGYIYVECLGAGV